MGVCCVGNMSQADWAEIKKLCRAMRKEFDKKLDELDAKLEAEMNRRSAIPGMESQTDNMLPINSYLNSLRFMPNELK